jgi:hypothetical protein
MEQRRLLKRLDNRNPEESKDHVRYYCALLLTYASGFPSCRRFTVNIRLQNHHRPIKFSEEHKKLIYDEYLHRYLQDCSGVAPTEAALKVTWRVACFCANPALWTRHFAMKCQWTLSTSRVCGKRLVLSRMWSKWPLL